MRDIILNALQALDIANYQIESTETESAELFFIQKTLDMRRTKRTTGCTVTVYRDFEADGVKFRGSSQTQIFEGMTPDEIRGRIKDAFFAAQFVKNPFYELYAGKKEAPVEMPSTLADRSLEEDALVMAEALFAADTDEDAFINSAEIFAIKSRVGILSSAGVDIAYTRYEVKGEFVTQ